MKTKNQPSIWRNFMIMLLAFSIMINGLFIYKIKEDKMTIQTNVAAVKEELESDYQNQIDQLNQKNNILTKENDQLKDSSNSNDETDTKGKNELIDQQNASDLISEQIKQRSEQFVESYLNFSDMYDQNRITSLQEVAIQDVVDRLVPKLDQGLSEQGEVDKTVLINSKIDSAKIFLGDYDKDTERAEVICDVEYTTTVDGKETKTHNLFTLKLEKMNGKFMVTSFSYHSII